MVLEIEVESSIGSLIVTDQLLCLGGKKSGSGLGILTSRTITKYH